MPVQAAAVPVVSSLSPASGTIGAEVTITGSGFTGATGVTFNTAASEFTVDSAFKITATVPAGASTGPVAVTRRGDGANHEDFHGHARHRAVCRERSAHHHRDGIGRRVRD